jgi:hypothetical protein
MLRRFLTTVLGSRALKVHGDDPAFADTAMISGLFDRPGWTPEGRWSDDERLTLARAWRRGESLRDLAERHCRSIESVARQLQHQGAIDGATAHSMLNAALRPGGWDERAAA